TADREATAAEEDAQTSGPQWRANWMMWARALVLEAQGKGDSALRMLTKAWEQCSGAGVVAEYPVLGPDLVRMALRGGERLLAEEALEAYRSMDARRDAARALGRLRGIDRPENGKEEATNKRSDRSRPGPGARAGTGAGTMTGRGTGAGTMAEGGGWENLTKA